MFRNILVAVDGSGNAELALRHALDLVAASRGRLGLLSVAPRVGPWSTLPPFALPVSRAQMDADLEAEAKRHLDRAVQSVPGDVPLTTLLARGRATDVLLTHALDGPWDLIVVGGRVGARLARRSPIPVLVVRDEPAAEPAPSPAPLVDATSPTRIRPRSRRSIRLG